MLRILFAEMSLASAPQSPSRPSTNSLTTRIQNFFQVSTNPNFSGPRRGRRPGQIAYYTSSSQAVTSTSGSSLISSPNQNLYNNSDNHNYPQNDTQALLDGVTKKLEAELEAELKKLEKSRLRLPYSFSNSSNTTLTMAAPEQQLATRPQQLVFVDGVFSDLAQEMADYLHISDDVKPLIEQDQKDEVLKKIILASVALHSVPEKEFTAAYNLLIHLVLQSDNISMFLPRVCDNLMKPVGSSLLNGPSLSLNVLGNIFNLLEPENPLRYNVFMTILRFIKENGMLDTITNYLSSLPEWFKDWDTNEEDQRKLYLEVADVADEYLREE